MSIRKRLSRFLHDEQGSMVVEGMIMLPILIWCYVGTFVFFDAFRAQSTNVKAAYVIGDTLSRETGYVTPQYMDSMWNLHQFLANGNPGVDLRITVFRFELATNSYRVRWSQGRGGPPALTNATLAAVRDNLPDMSDMDIAILTETWVNYTPRYEVGLTDFAFENFVVTRPRFAPQLCWNTLNNGGPATAVC
jgi:hypothetical protein